MSVVTVTIKSGKVIVPQAYELLYVDVSREFNKIPQAELCYKNGDVAEQKFEVSESKFFEPGKEIEILLRYEDKPRSEKTVFKGIVLRQSLKMNEGGSSIVVELSDSSVKMTNGRKSLVFNKEKDSDIIKTLIEDSGLTSDVEATKVAHKRLVQYYATNWDFMLSRAEVNGLMIMVTDGTVVAKQPKIKGRASQTLKLGIDTIYNIELEADATHQFAAVQSSIWDIKKQKLSPPIKAAKYKLEQGNFNPETFAKAVGGKFDALVTAVPLDDKEAQAWADAKMMRNRLSMLKGRISIDGTADLKLGDVIRIEGVGKRYTGRTIVSGLRHRVTEDGWITDIQFGISAEPFSSNTNIVDAKAAGLLPGVNGLQIGVVQNFEEDEEKQNLVKVIVPAINNAANILWARLTSPDAGKKRGAFFFPEPGDEVILGFLNDDPRQPVILGSVYSSSNASPLKPVDKNPEKGIVTKEGLKIIFNDEKKIITISTSDNSSVIINDKEKFIEIKDANKNVVKLSDKGISLQSDKDVIIKSGANVKIEGKAVEIKGNKVDVI